jgi:hypothetical protein
MKKAFFTSAILLSVLAVQAQEPFDPVHDRQLYFDILNILAVLGGIYLISSFLLQIVKQHYSYRIRNRILDKGTEENIVRQILRPEKKERRNSILQWFFMLAAIGIGLILITLITPFGLHSLAILALSLAAGFGAYYYFSRPTVERPAE